MLVYLANLCCQKVLCALCPGVVGWKCFSHGPLTTAAVLDCRSRLKQKCFRLWAHHSQAELAVWARRNPGSERVADPASKLGASRTSAVWLSRLTRTGQTSKSIPSVVLEGTWYSSIWAGKGEVLLGLVNPVSEPGLVPGEVM
jgi:hypothetical protein